MGKKNLSRVRTGNTGANTLTDEQLAFMGKAPAELRGAAADLKVVPAEPPSPAPTEDARPERKRTTVYLTPENHRRLKVHCISRGLEMSKVIDGLVADYLDASDS